MSAHVTLRRRLSDWLRGNRSRTSLSYEAGEDPADDDIAAVQRGLASYNERFMGASPQIRVGAFARDETGRIVAGAHGTVTWGWLYVERLWVDEALRGDGVGTEVLARLERAALAHGVFRFRVDTASFQALDFYIKQGYDVFAQLEDSPPGHTDYYLKKRIELNP
ncbi:MAG: GNAT family N-acetyltransferase [Pseudomonadota bacterium]